MDTHRVIVITGANRGIGLEFVNQLLFAASPPLHKLCSDAGCTGYTVLPLCRTFNQSQWDEIESRLDKFNDEHSSSPNFVRRFLLPLRCDVLVEQDIITVKDTITSSTTLPHRIDYLISNSGIIEENPSTSISSLTSFDPTNTKIICTNSIAPIVLTNILLPLLQTAASQSEPTTIESPTFDSTINPGVQPSPNTTNPIKQHAQCLYISSNMGSISHTNMPLCPTYRASKCALNMYVKCLAMENPAINFMPISPGWCDTDMGSRGGRTPPQTVQESVTGMFKQMNLYWFQHYSGQHLFSFDDTFVPW